MKAVALLILALILSASGVAAQPVTPPAADDHIDTVTVEANKIPLEHAIHNFVQSYAEPTQVTGKIARWSTRIPLCPEAKGLQAAVNVFVTERIRSVAGMVGAPLNPSARCKSNLVVIFTTHPQDVLDDIAKSDEDLLGYHEVSQTKQLATMTHPVEAWYETATRDMDGTLRMDTAQQNPLCATIMGLTPFDFEKFQQYCGAAKVTGNLLDNGLSSEIGEVTIIVDANKIVGMPLGAVSDYIAMLALSQTKAFETCQPLPSITNLMTSNCDAQKVQALSESDTAYLKAIYKTNPDVIGSIQSSEIAHQMEAELGGH